MNYINEGLTEFLNSVGSALPGVLGAILVLIVGWFLANAGRRLVRFLLGKTDLDNRLLKNVNSDLSAEKFISNLVYYLLMIFVLLVVLEMLGVSQVLDPLRNMIGEFFDFFPNIIAALLIGFVGYIIAKLVSELVGVGTQALDGISERVGLGGEGSIFRVSNILKKVVFIFIIIPVLIAAFDALKIEAISAPATEMLSTFINAVPQIFAAVLIVVVFYIGGRFVVGLLKDVLESLGTDQLSEKLNLTSIIGQQSLSHLLSNIAFFFLMFFGIITGVEKLGFVKLNEALSNVLDLTGNIFFGLILLAIGNFLSNIAYKALNKGEESNFIASIARIAILGLFLGISLNEMGIADNIVNMAFGLTLGAIAVAVALAFGLGGREAAGKQMEHILKKFRGEK